jgi:hypothetical protein
VVTGGLLLITVPHFGEFTAQNFPYRWTIFYSIDPLVVALIVWRLRANATPSGHRNRLTPLMVVYGATLGIVGAVLLVVPTLAAGLWPWTLPPILAHTYSVFFLTFALGAALVMREPRWEGARVYVQANLGMLLLIIGVSLWHLDRFKPGLPIWAWYALCAAGVVAFGAAWLRHPGRLAAKGAAS